MKIFPAIDIKAGRCVRLFQGRMDQETVYGDDPVAMACRWRDAGARQLHVVDLDGAVSGRPVHGEIIQKICQTTRLSIQVGGGIRSLEDVMYYMNMGIDRVVLGSAMIHDVDLVLRATQKFPGKIAAGIDAKEGWVAIRGWTEVTSIQATDLAVRLDQNGIAAIIYTDIQRDGTLQGPNLDALSHLCRLTRIPILASGGISSLKDLRDLLSLEKEGLEGAIVGKALYAGTIGLAEAMQVMGG